MNPWLGSAAFAMAVMSAIALYASSLHCPWSLARHRPRATRLAGIAAALLSLALWTHLGGFAVGLCTMLACLMLSLISVPLLSLLGPHRRASTVEPVDVG